MNKCVSVTNPFGGGALDLNVTKNTKILDIKKMVVENLGFNLDDHPNKCLYPQNAMLPIIYSPKCGLLNDYDEFGSVEHQCHSLYCYYFPKLGYYSSADIRLQSGYSLLDVLFSVIIKIGGSYYSVMLPRKNIGSIKSELRYFISDQLSSIYPKINFLDENLVLRNQRSGKKIFLSDVDFRSLEGKNDVFLLETINSEDSLLDKIIIREFNSHLLDTADNDFELIKINPVKPLEVNGVRIEIINSDIAFQNVDSIANAANPYLSGGGGVDGAIHKMAGKELVESSRIFSPCEPGSSILTPGFKLLSNWVIHTVGPVYYDGKKGEDIMLAQAYESCLKIALKSKFQSIALPAISTGIYGYPLEDATRIAVHTFYKMLSEIDCPSLRLVKFVVFDSKVEEVYLKVVEEMRA